MKTQVHQLFSKRFSLFMLLGLFSFMQARAVCIANFTFSVNHNTKTVSFNNTSTGIGSYWTFGDGGTSTGKNPLHTYNGPGTYNVCLITFDSLCSDTICKQVTINNSNSGCASFTYTINHSTRTVTFTNTSTASSAASYIWTFGGNGNSNLKNPTHTFSSPGTYKITMRVMDSLCHDTDYQWITINPGNCNAAFYDSVNHVTRTVSFANTSIGKSFYWLFGDGGTSTAANPTHTYSAPGTYNVCLIAFDSLCSDSVCKTVTVNGTGSGCHASFTYTINQSTKTVSFSSTSIGASTYWTFGDGGTSTNKAPTHTYNGAGTYQVCLIVTDSLCADTFCTNITINNISCNASFTYIIDSNNVVRFNNQSTGSNLVYSWTFGSSGASSTLKNPSYYYANSGSYQVCLTISSTTDTSCHSTQCKIVTVNHKNTCQAAFSYSINQTTKKVTLTNTTSGTGFTYNWSFGDGGTSTLKNPTHIYANPGTYQICLTIIRASDSCYNTKCSTIVIQGSSVPCTANFYYSITPQNRTVNFTNTSLPSTGLTYVWTFGDSTSSTLKSPSHQYAANGTYNVCLRVSRINSIDTCFDIKCMTITINNQANCLANFNFSINHSTKTVSFNNTSTGNNLSYSWNFGDSSAPSTQQNPSHTYSANGTYYVCLTIYNFMDSCYNTYCIPVNVGATGIGRNAARLQMKEVFPVPFTNTLNLKLIAEEAGPAELKVFDIYGRQVHSLNTRMEQGENHTELNLAELSRGVYWLELRMGNERLLKQILK